MAELKGYRFAGCTPGVEVRQRCDLCSKATPKNFVGTTHLLSQCDLLDSGTDCVDSTEDTFKKTIKQ
ncbi:hypothetical protein GN958_ATG16179 [Phytophthora infestans]|uniref:Uncharacterized protein n=1 Tax=Phytophthora infestans TaxID=4787 RepID=A0A8S9U4P0_PHYIN|nr:hypothetical protein GN958_ATG16179 [Phytophthora infestans]